MTDTPSTKTTSRSAISRRTFINVGTAATATVLAAPYVSNKARAKSKTLYINTWGGSWGKAEAKAYYVPFEKATGITVKPVTPFSLAKLKAQVRTGNYQFSVAGMGRSSSISALKENLLEHE